MSFDCCFLCLAGSDLWMPRGEYRVAAKGTPGFLFRFLFDGGAPSNFTPNASSWLFDLLLISTYEFVFIDAVVSIKLN